MSLLERVYAIESSDITGAVTVTNSSNITDIGSLVNLVIKWLIYIAGVLAFFYLIYSGILYVTAAGNPDQAKKGQQGIINAVIGIVIITLAFVILRAVSKTAETGNIGG